MVTGGDGFRCHAAWRKKGYSALHRLGLLQ